MRTVLEFNFLRYSIQRSFVPVTDAPFQWCGDAGKWGNAVPHFFPKYCIIVHAIVLGMPAFPHLPRHSRALPFMTITLLIFRIITLITIIATIAFRKTRNNACRRNC